MQKVSMYDPSKNAFREISVELAKKFIASAKDVEEKIAKIEVKK